MCMHTHSASKDKSYNPLGVFYNPHSLVLNSVNWEVNGVTPYGTRFYLTHYTSHPPATPLNVFISPFKDKKGEPIEIIFGQGHIDSIWDLDSSLSFLAVFLSTDRTVHGDHRVATDRK